MKHPKRKIPVRLYCVFQGLSPDPFWAGTAKPVATALVTGHNTVARNYHMAEYRLVSTERKEG